MDGEALTRMMEVSDEDVSSALRFIWCLQVCLYDPILDKCPFGFILIAEDEKDFRYAGMFSFDAAVSKDEDTPFCSSINREKERK